MALAIEQITRCTATARSTGEQCRLEAIPGGTVCRHHGGSAPQVQAAAQRRITEQRIAYQAMRPAAIRDYLPPQDIQPHEPLLDAIRHTAGRVRYWQQRVTQLTTDDLEWSLQRETTGGPLAGRTWEATPHVAYRLLAEETDRLARMTTAAIRAGVAAERVRLAREDGQRLITTLETFLTRLGLADDPAARAALADIIRAHDDTTSPDDDTSE